ncbi:MAG TPA: leucine-rich repeat domain-containing protein [Candidatus Limiplasma sp.]|nr:leucine-rich repeat domain-containing protein [Candidatus Limiplasma sp.]
MVCKRVCVLLLLPMLALVPLQIALADDYEGDAESNYDDRLSQLDTVSSGDWLYLKQTDGTLALERYQGTATDVTVPVTLDGLTVTMVDSYCFPQDTLLTITVPEGITTLATDAFLFSPVETVSLSEGLKTIGDTAFFGCEGLTSLVIPSTVTSIGLGAFQGCNQLTEVTIPEGITALADNLLCDCTSLTRLTLPASVLAIGDLTLPENPALTLVAPEGSFAQQYAKEHNIAFEVRGM